MEPQRDEQSIVEAARRGDVDAFNELVELHQRRVYNLAYRLTGDAHAAADATQEAFIAAFNNLSAYRGGSFRAWLMQIAANQCYDELRRRKRRPTLSTDTVDGGEREGEPRIQLVADPDEGPEQQAMRSALSDAIQGCLNELAPDFRMVAVLADVQGYDYREVADLLRVSLGTVKSRLSRARERLRDCLRGIGELLPDVYRLRNQGDTRQQA